MDPGSKILACIQSVKQQGHTRVEHIVVDGGSTDGTPDLLTRTPGVRFISEADEGQADAINKGFRMAEGDLVGWLNADDQLSPEALETIASAYRQHGTSEWFYGDCAQVEDSSTTLLRGPRFLTHWTFDLGNRIPQPGCLVSSQAMERVGFLDASFDLTMDFDLWLRLQGTGVRPTYVSRTLATFHVHPGSKTGSIPEWRFTLEEALALLKSGRPAAASVAFGRAAARKVSDDPAQSENDLTATVSDVIGAKDVDERLARGAARVEYALRSGGFGGLARGMIVGRNLHPLVLRMIAASVKSRVAAGGRRSHP